MPPVEPHKHRGRKGEVDKYPHAPQSPEPTVEKLSNSVSLRRVEKGKEKLSERGGGGGGGNLNPKQMASIGARNTESHRKKMLLCF